MPAISSRLSALSATFSVDEFRSDRGPRPQRAVSRRLLTLMLVAAAAVAATACRQASASPTTTSLRRLIDVRLTRDSEVLRAVVPHRSTLSSVLETHQLVAHEAVALVRTMAEKFDLRRVRAGQPYRLDRFLDGRIREFEYEIDVDRRLVVRRLDPTGVAFEAELAAIPKTIDQVIVTGEISRDTPTLVQALEAAGERIELGLALADLFSGEMDFNSDLQPGDRFRIIVERAVREDGVFAGYGPVFAAEYVNAGRPFQAVRFTPPDGKPGYYDAAGRSLKRFFLKSPLKFEPRITSSFSRARRHPVLNYTRAHNGVDYGAPTGAPVAAVAGGVVTFAGWTHGGGRTVKVRHAGGYDSEYLHLSSISVKSGARVGQGELVGRVGATGMVTGPHLHYGLRRNGAYVNPVREHQNMPPGEPVAALHFAAFTDQRDRLFKALAANGVRTTNND